MWVFGDRRRVGTLLVRAGKVDLLDIAQYVCELQARQGFWVKAESMERIVGRAQVAFDKTLVFVYLGKLHHLDYFISR
jgi:hypothetical protein